MEPSEILKAAAPVVFPGDNCLFISTAIRIRPDFIGAFFSLESLFNTVTFALQHREVEQR